MFDYIIDFLVIIIFLYIARMLWVFSIKKNTSQVKLLFRTISLFVILHLVIFPIMYVFVINQNSDSIKIEESIMTYERDLKLEEAKRIERRIDSTSNNKKQKLIINEVLKNNLDSLKKVDWKSVNNNNRIIFLDSNLIKGYTQFRTRPGDQIHRVITIYSLEGIKLIEFQTFSEEKELSGILIDHLKELDSQKDEIKEKIETIKANKFWSYRQVLPYTLNILFTDNFSPQSRNANIIYFIHNILVVGFLLTFIINLFQYYLINNKQK